MREMQAQLLYKGNSTAPVFKFDTISELPTILSSSEDLIRWRKESIVDKNLRMVYEHEEILALDFTQQWILAPHGVWMRASEYNKRYGGLDIASIQARLSPVAFKAFMDTVGIVELSPTRERGRSFVFYEYEEK